jgi:hypothetical protein
MAPRNSRKSPIASTSISLGDRKILSSGEPWSYLFIPKCKHEYDYRARLLLLIVASFRIVRNVVACTRNSIQDYIGTVWIFEARANYYTSTINLSALPLSPLDSRYLPFNSRPIPFETCDCIHVDAYLAIDKVYKLPKGSQIIII